MSKTKTVEKGKALVRSKTFWFNILAVAIAIASLFGFDIEKSEEEVAGIIAIISAVGNVILRTKTSEKITRVL